MLALRSNGLIINTKIESFKAVNNIAKVISIPKAFKTPIKKGDLIMIHHNVFRRFYDMKGREKNSKSYFKDNMYFVQLDQVYLYKPKDKYKRGINKPIEKTALEATFGDVIGDIIPATQREIFDEIQDVYSDLNIKATNAQKKNFERTFAMQVSEGVGAFVPELAKFALANAITGGILGAAKTMVMTAQGWKAITWANRLNQLKRVKVFLIEQKD